VVSELAATEPRPPRVVLVSMPWAGVSEPSLGLGILKACLRREGVFARIRHFYPFLLRHVTYETYTMLADCAALNEFVFTAELDDDIDERQLDTLVDRCAELEAVRHSKYPSGLDIGRMVLRLRNEVVPAYLRECADAVLADRPTLVGFSCMFDQTLASVALAKVIAERDPSVSIVLGGYALEGPPSREVLKAFPFVDGIVLGDGEPVISELAQRSSTGAPFDGIAGCVTPAHPDGGRPAVRMVLDDVPTPDFDDWFDDLAMLAAEGIEIRHRVLPVETSRGCWWGQAKHCIFCGIDEDTLRYRSKSPGTALAMLLELRERYGDKTLRFCDYILPRPFYDGLLPDLAELEDRFTLLCEIKANQTPQRVELFARAGFVEMQPGIESFSTEVLRLMDKGVRGIDNVSLLKAAYRNRVAIDYNIIYAFPGESREAYLEMLENIPRIYHLAPPVSRSDVKITRFAPLHADPGRFGFGGDYVHDPIYEILFSAAFRASTGFRLSDYCYYFERPYQVPAELQELHEFVCLQVDYWKNRQRNHDDPAVLSHEPCDGGTLVRDTRFPVATSVRLDAVETGVLSAFDLKPTRVSAARAALLPHGTSPEAFDSAFRRLNALRLLWVEAGWALSLPVEAEIVAEHVRTRWTDHWPALRY
jgi:ribosomal peptide maturation radical SAM protein 1